MLIWVPKLNLAFAAPFTYFRVENKPSYSSYRYYSTSRIPIDRNDVTGTTPPTNTLLVKMRTFYGPFKTFFKEQIHISAKYILW